MARVNSLKPLGVRREIGVLLRRRSQRRLKGRLWRLMEKFYPLLVGAGNYVCVYYEGAFIARPNVCCFFIFLAFLPSHTGVLYAQILR